MNENCKGPPDMLKDMEEDFFTLVAEGDVFNVKQFLRKHKTNDGELDFNPNCVNFENANAMSVAIEQGNTEMIKYLASIMDISKKTILLKAIHKGDVDLVRFLCEGMGADVEVVHGEEVKHDSPLGEPEFHSDITPLMLAAIEGHFEIIGYLLGRGHSLPALPHKPECDCKPCARKFFDPPDALDTAVTILHLYAALSNPVYFIYITADPFFYAFKIHRRLLDLSKQEVPFKCSYEQLARRVSRFAACLVSECLSTSEIELVLKQASTPNKFLDKVGQGEFPRLMMALDFNQKEFLSQPNVQLFMEEKFYGSFEDWRYLSNLTKCSYTVIRLLTILPAYFNFVLYPSSLSAKFYAAPINKMMHFLSMHLLFLVVLVLEIKRRESCVRDRSMHSVWDLFVFIYFCGLAGAVFHQYLHFGHKRFLSLGWNVYDVVMLSMYALSIAFGFSSIVHNKMPGVQHSERKYWSSSDPQLMSEGFAVVANVLAYMKLLFFFQATRAIGSLQVGVYQVVKNFAWFSVFGIGLLLAYTSAFSNFYSYYNGMTFTDPVSKEKYTQEESFISWFSTFKTLFWGTWGQSDVESADVIIDNTDTCKPHFYNQHLFTQFIGYLALASFSLLMIMIIKNMLIATMVKVYEALMGGIHKSWLLWRVQILVYFLTFPVMPPPFNLLPQLYTRRMLRERADLETASKIGYDHRKDYLELVKILVLRYFNRMKKDKDCEEETILHSHCGVPIATPKTKCLVL